MNDHNADRGTDVFVVHGGIPDSVLAVDNERGARMGLDHLAKLLAAVQWSFMDGLTSSYTESHGGESGPTHRSRRHAAQVGGDVVSDANKELVRRYFEELFNDRDFDVADKLMTEDYVEHAQAPFNDREPGRVNGPRATRETVRWLREQFPDMRMSIEAIVAEGDIVVARVLGRGTNLGKLNGVIPATGRTFEARQSHWFRIVDSKLAEHWVTREDLVVMRQLGVIPPRPALVARLIWSQAQRLIRPGISGLQQRSGEDRRP